MGLGYGAFSFVTGGHGHSPHLGQLLQLGVGFGQVHSVSRHQHRAAGLGKYLHGPLDVLGSALGFGRVQVTRRVVDEGRRFQVYFAADGRRAHDHGRRSRPAAGGMLYRQLSPDGRLFGIGGQGGVFGHGLEDGRQVYAAVFTGARLIGGVHCHAAVGGVGEDQHGRAAQHGLHDPEGRIGANE